MAVAASDAFDPHARLAVLVFFAVALVLMAMAAYAFDRERRLAYLAERQTRLLNAELQRVSHVDTLTGLWNRPISKASWLRPVAVARCLADNVHAGAAAVRYGGEEFLVFAPDCEAGRARALADRSAPR